MRNPQIALFPLDHTMRRLTLLLLFCLFSLLACPAAPARAAYAVRAFYDLYDLIDTVNQLRAANGLDPYQANTALIISAQAHSEYQASIGTWSHSGADGSDEAQRAIAAGYGGGASIKCDEAVGFTYNYNVHQIVYDMWGVSPTHLGILLNTQYRDVGGGVAVSGDYVYYTIDACVIVGGNYPSSGSSGSNSAPSAQEATLAPILPATVTPQADGSIIHTVRENETLINIALAYNIPLRDLLEMNNLTPESVIYPGEKLLIQQASTPTPTEAITSTPTPRPATPTRRPTRSPTPMPPTATATVIVATPTATPVPARPMDTFGKVIVGAIVTFGVVGVLLMITGEVLKRKK
jgi:LysM repeat protein